MLRVHRAHIMELLQVKGLHQVVLQDGAKSSLNDLLLRRQLEHRDVVLPHQVLDHELGVAQLLAVVVADPG